VSADIKFSCQVIEILRPGLCRADRGIIKQVNIVFMPRGRARLTRRANHMQIVIIATSIKKPAPIGRGLFAFAAYLMLTNVPQAAASPAAVRT
jgi:hypothetical protein